MRTEVFLYSWPWREKPRLLRPKARIRGPIGDGMAVSSKHVRVSTLFDDWPHSVPTPHRMSATHQPSDQLASGGT